MKLSEIRENGKQTIEKDVKVGEFEFKVKDYISAEDKLKLIGSVTQICKVDGKINPVVLDVAFTTMVVKNYTDIELSEEDSKDLLGVYDVLEQNKIIENTIGNIPKVEYDALEGYLQDAIEIENKYDYSIIGVVTQLMEGLPKFMETIGDQLKDFNPEDYQKVIDLANKVK